MPCHLCRWSFESWSPTLFGTVRHNPTDQQTAPDLWSRVPGAGAKEARRGGLRWYPECTQKGYPHCPSPPAQNSALTISCSSPIHSYYCSVHAASTRNKRQLIHHRPRSRAQRSHTREDGTKHPPSASHRDSSFLLFCACASVLRVLAAADRWVWDEVPRADSGGHAYRAHPSCWVTPHPLHPPSTHQPTHHQHYHHQPRNTNICVSVATVPPQSGRRQVLRGHMV